MPPLRSAEPAFLQLRILGRQSGTRAQLIKQIPRRWNHVHHAPPSRPIYIQRTWNPLRTYRGPLLVAQLFAAYIIWARLSAWMLPEELDAASAENVLADNKSAVKDDGTIEAEDQIFLPLWWPRMLPRAAYANSDPTWQEFCKFSREKDLQKSAKDAVCTMVLEKYGKAFEKALGGDLKIGRVWLDAVYPEGPPPTYARPGLSFVNDGILITDQIVPHAEYIRMRHLAYPGPFISAFKAALSSYTSLKTVKIKRALGLNMNQHDQKLLNVRAHEVRRMEQVDALRKAVQRQEQLDQESTKAGPLDSASQSMTPAASSAASNPAEDEEAGWKFPSLTLPVIAPPMTLDCVVALQVGIQTWKKSWLESRRDNMPPGAMFFEGIVEIVGPQRRAKCSLLAAYDPKQRKVVYVNPPTPLRVIDSKQRPKGGPPTLGV